MVCYPRPCNAKCNKKLQNKTSKGTLADNGPPLNTLQHTAGVHVMTFQIVICIICEAVKNVVQSKALSIAFVLLNFFKISQKLRPID